LAAAFCAEEAFNSSEALPKEKARRRRDFPRRFGSFFSSARRLAAGDSDGGDDAVVLWAVVGPVFGDSAEVDGCERGEGLLARFSSGLPVLLVIELASGDGTRTYQNGSCQFYHCLRNLHTMSEGSLTEEVDECAEWTLPELSRCEWAERGLWFVSNAMKSYGPD
jgi:hypothetical protein